MLVLDSDSYLACLAHGEGNNATNYSYFCELRHIDDILNVKDLGKYDDSKVKREGGENIGSFCIYFRRGSSSDRRVNRVRRLNYPYHRRVTRRKRVDINF